VGAPVTRTGAATAGAIPTNEGCTLVFAAASPERMRQETVTDIEAGFRRVLAAAAPHFAPRLEGRSPVERYRRFPGIPGPLAGKAELYLTRAGQLILQASPDRSRSYLARRSQGRVAVVASR
jgi:hypothetical protein